MTKTYFLAIKKNMQIAEYRISDSYNYENAYILI